MLVGVLRHLQEIQILNLLLFQLVVMQSSVYMIHGVKIMRQVLKFQMLLVILLVIIMLIKLILHQQKLSHT